MPKFNEQFQEVLDQIETGLGAFEHLLGLSNGMSKLKEDFDVLEDVDECYNQEDHKIYRDFIRMGLTFVKGHPDARPPEIPVTPPPKEKANKNSFPLSQVENFDSSNTLVKEEKVEENHEKKVKTEIKTKKKRGKVRRRGRKDS